MRFGIWASGGLVDWGLGGLGLGADIATCWEFQRCT